MSDQRLEVAEEPARRRASRVRSLCWFAVAVLLALPLISIPSRWTSTELLDAGHLPLLGLLTLVLFFALPRSSPLRHYLQVAVLAVAAAALIELLQPWFQRQASTRDFVVGVVGVAIALSGLWLWRELDYRIARVLHGVVTLLIVAAVAQPVWAQWQADRWRQAQMPQLGDFEDAIELQLWRGQGGEGLALSTVELVSQHATSGRAALKVNAAKGTWSGAHFVAGFSAWGDYRELGFDIYNPGAAFPLGVHVEANGRNRPRFVRIYTIAEGLSQIRIPMEAIRNGPGEGVLDLDNVSRLMFYTGRNQPARIYYLDNVRLIP